MDNEDYLERHLDLCQEIYERMKRDGSWPWCERVDSPNSADMVDSEHITDDA